jgi:hypothetical protein
VFSEDVCDLHDGFSDPVVFGVVGDEVEDPVREVLVPVDLFE